MTRKAGDAIINWKSLLLLLRLLQDMTKLLRFFSALFAADHMLLLCEEVVEMPVVVVVMIEFIFSFVRKGRDRRKKERLCVFPRLSFFLSPMGQQLQSPAATTALCTLPKRALPGAQVRERERERDILQTPTYCS
jgi:hypothetical protein